MVVSSCMDALGTGAYCPGYGGSDMGLVDVGLTASEKVVSQNAKRESC